MLHIEGDEKTTAIAYKRGVPHSNKLYQSLTKTPVEDMASLLARAMRSMQN